MKLAPPLFAVLAALLAGCQQPQAPQMDVPQSKVHESKADEVRAANSNLPFLKIQSIALQAVPGEVVRVDLEQEHGQDIYEFKILATSGRVIELEIDAVTGRILKQEAD